MTLSKKEVSNLATPTSANFDDDQDYGSNCANEIGGGFSDSAGR